MKLRSASDIRARMLALAFVLLAASPVAATDGSIRCRATDPSGRRIDGTCRAAGSGGSGGSCHTSGGACTIPGLPPGSYTVTLRTLSGRSSAPRTVRVDDGASPTVVLTARETAAVSFEHEGGAVSLVPLPVAGADAGTGSDADAGATADSRADAGATTSGDGGTTSPGDGGGEIVADATEARTTAVQTVSPVTAAAASTVPDRSSGTTLALQGRTSDSRGRILDGTITVSKDGRAIARTTTSGGRYQLYDLPSGALSLTFRAVSGATATSGATYAGSALTVNLAVP